MACENVHILNSGRRETGCVILYVALLSISIYNWKATVDYIQRTDYARADLSVYAMNKGKKSFPRRREMPLA
jgi:hypothetical protein